MPVTNQALSGGYQLLNYRIDRQISRGGFSIVYRAFDETGVPVAIKEYLPSSLVLRTEGDIVRATSAENMASFRYGMKCFFEEGRALAKITHPNVVRVLNFFRANETVYMVMRYERGRTLQQQIQMRQDQMSERLVRHVFMHLLNGLREVHTHKLLHLDIKPANIYLRTDGSPVLLDFGAARQTLTTQRPKLAPMYTPGFAAPEQYRDPDRLGPWTDVYGVGASMFACLAAFAPQAADARQQEDHLVSAKKIWAGQYSDNVLEVIDWCLRLDPLERPQSVFALQKAIRDIPPKKRKVGFLGNLKKKALHRDRPERDADDAIHDLPGVAQGLAHRQPGPHRVHVQPRHAAARRRRRDGRSRRRRDRRADRRAPVHRALSAGGEADPQEPAHVPARDDGQGACRARLVLDAVLDAGNAAHHVRRVHRAGGLRLLGARRGLAPFALPARARSSPRPGITPRCST